MSDIKPNLNAFVVCREMLVNSRNPSVISIVDIYNQLQVSRFPAHIETICFIALYSGVPGEYTHHFEIWDGEDKVGDTGKESFFLETRNSIFHAAAYLDGLVVETPKHLTIKSILDGETMGRTTLGIFKPLNSDKE